MRNTLRIIRAHIERSSEIQVFEIRDHDGNCRVKIPLIDGWAQASIEVKRPLSIAEQARFFRFLKGLVVPWQKGGLIRSWYFIHKDPGLRLRFRVGNKRDRLLTELAQAFGTFRFDWSGDVYFDSFLEQRELFSSLRQTEVEKLLWISSETHLESVAHRLLADEDHWSHFTVDFLGTFLQDSWWVWEALGRMQRLRRTTILQNIKKPSRQVLHDPSQMLQRVQRLRLAPKASVFPMSMSLLCCLNYIFNQWAISEKTQRNILDKARELTQPLLAGHDDSRT